MKRDIFKITTAGKKKEKNLTFFQRFLFERVSNYVEPQRKGTPKGEPIGLFRNKYNAALCMLTNIPQKEIAEGLGISFGLLRKWNTEDSFKDLIQELCYEFVDEVIQYILNEVNKIASKVDKNLAKGAALPSPTVDFGDDFKDSSILGECILEELKERIYSIIDSLPKKQSVSDLDRAVILQLVLVHTFFKVDESYIRLRKSMMKSYLKRMTCRLHKIHEEYLDDSERREAALILTNIERFIEKA